MSLNLSNLASTAHQGFNYVFAGVSSHFAGEVVELMSIPILQGIPCVNVIKIPVSKVLHETAESFFSSSSMINMYRNEDGLWESLKHITKPIWSSPIETIFAGFASYHFELLAVQLFSLQQCNHAHDHEHHHGTGLFSTDNLIKGLASAAGSLVASFVYEKAEELYDYYFANDAECDEDAASMCCSQLIEFNDVMDQCSNDTYVC